MTLAPIRIDDDQIPILDQWFMRVIEQTSDGIRMQPIGSTRAASEIFFSYDELLELEHEGRFCLERQAGDGFHKPPRKAVNFEHLPEALRKEALKRLEYVRACDQIFGMPASKRAFKKTPEDFQKIARIIGKHRLNSGNSEGREAFSGSTLREWYNRWRKRHDILDLVPRHADKGVSHPKLDPIVAKVIEEIVKTDYLTPERPSISIVYDYIIIELEEMRANNEVLQDIPNPSLVTVHRWIKRKLTPYEITVRREGLSRANHLYGRRLPAPKVTRLLEMVEIDATKLDVMLIKEPGFGTKDPTYARPFLVMMIDKASRMILGFDLTFKPINQRTLLDLLRSAIFPKLEPEGRIKTEWPAFGVPEVLLADNGKEFHAQSVKDAAHSLGIDYRHCAPYEGHLKGTIERHFGRIARDYAALPGRTWANTREKGDYKSRHSAILTLEAAFEELNIWVRDIYHNTPQRGLNQLTPLQAWKKLAKGGVRYMPSRRDLTIALALKHFKRYNFQHGGIVWNDLVYCSERLFELASRPKSQENIFAVKRWDLDLTVIHLLDPEMGIWIDVPCINVERDDLEDLCLDEWLSSRNEQSKVNPEDAASAYVNKLIARSETRARMREKAAQAEDGRRPLKGRKKKTPAAGSNAEENLELDLGLDGTSQSQDVVIGYEELARELSCNEDDATLLAVEIIPSGAKLKKNNGTKTAGKAVFKRKDIQDFIDRYISLDEIVHRSGKTEAAILVAIEEGQIRPTAFSSELINAVYFDRVIAEKFLRLKKAKSASKKA